jgi:serine/threonine protein kinase
MSRPSKRPRTRNWRDALRDALRECGYTVSGVPLVLGRGSFGVVMAATARDGAPVAVKLISRADEDTYERVAGAQTLMQRMDHPSLLLPTEIITWRLAVYPRWDMDLHGFINRHGHVATGPRLARDVARSVAAGLAHLHERGCAHLDVKPSNVLVRLPGRGARPPGPPPAPSGPGAPPPPPAIHPAAVCLCDFDSVQPIAEGVHPEWYVVTRWYRPPEVLTDETFTAAADVWSLGCVMYECLAGTTLFIGDTAVDQLRIIRGQRARTLRALMRMSPCVRVAAAISAALRYAADRRVSAAELVEYMGP